jgi:hypothetical protein
LEKGDELTPAQFPCLLAGFVVFRRLVILGDGKLGCRFGSAVVDLVTGFTAVKAEIVLPSFVFLGLSKRLARLNGVDFHRPRSDGGFGGLGGCRGVRLVGTVVVLSVTRNSSGSVSPSSLEEKVVPFDSRIDKNLERCKALRRQKSVLDVEFQTVEERLSKGFVTPREVKGVTFDLGGIDRGGTGLLEGLELLTRSFFDVRVGKVLGEFQLEEGPGYNPIGLGV